MSSPICLRVSQSGALRHAKCSTIDILRALKSQVPFPPVLDSPRISAAAFGMLHLSSWVGRFAQASQASGSDHVVGTPRSRRGQDVRRFTLGEENDATGN